MDTDANAHAQEDRPARDEMTPGVFDLGWLKAFDITNRANFQASSGVASLLSPTFRSMKAIGTSPMEYRCNAASQIVSTWNSYPPQAACSIIISTNGLRYTRMPEVTSLTGSPNTQR